MMLTGEMPIWNDEWNDRVKPAIAEHGKNHPVEEMSDQRIGNYEGFKEYQRAVFSRTQAHLESLDPNDLLRVVIPKPYPAEVATTYSARCAGDVGITVLDAFECWHYQHGLRHMAEIELARGFLGLSGMTARVPKSHRQVAAAIPSGQDSFTLHEKALLGSSLASQTKDSTD
jgi:hypothetical protein